MQGGKRMAVLAGCNYPGWPLSELKGCINDVVSMKNVLISKFGFKEDNIELLTDEPTSSNMPTGANIKKALERMIKQTEDGDLLVFHFSGHGTLLRDKNHGAIIPCDYNIITDMDIRQLVDKIHHKKATFTILADSCHSGGLIYQEKEQIGPSANPPNPKSNSCKRKYIPIEDIQNMFQQNTGLNLNIGDFMTLYFRDEASLSFQPNFQLNFQPNFQFGFNLGKAYDNGILLSACQNNEWALDDPDSNPPHGMFSYAVMTVLENNTGNVVSNRQLVMQTRKFLEGQGTDTQHPCLYSGDVNADTTFLLQRQASTN